MALTFLEAIVDVGKSAESVAIEKLKSHSKVGYQDHPMGHEQCSVCSMFVPGNPPSCTHVAPPINANGWCEDFEAHDRSADLRAHLEDMLGVKIGDDGIMSKDGPPDEARDDHGRWTGGGNSGGAPTRSQRDAKQVSVAEQRVRDLQRQLSEHSQDKSDDLYWGIHQSLQQARADLEGLKVRITSMVTKAFNPDEPRDAVGRWTSGEGGPDHPNWMHGYEGTTFADALGEVPSGMYDSIGKIEDAHSDLDASSQDAEDVVAHEDDIVDEHGVDSKEHRDWEQENSAHQGDVADKAMALRNAVADHLEATAGVLAQLDARIQKLADENGKRGG